jgi:PleD family two-component response regulator
MVLLVDDQPIVAETIRRMLADCADMDFHYCPNPAEAVAVASRIKPTVILQDLVMPEIDGLALMLRYRAEPDLRNVPIVVLSSKEDPQVKSHAFESGANDYLVKLPDRIELIARVRMHSGAYLTQVQRDTAHRALRESQRQLLETNAALRASNDELQQALSTVKQLSGLLPICSYCKRIRSDENYWETVDQYITDHTNAEFSHGVCPTCFDKVAADFDR